MDPPAAEAPKIPYSEIPVRKDLTIDPAAANMPRTTYIGKHSFFSTDSGPYCVSETI